MAVDVKDRTVVTNLFMDPPVVLDASSTPIPGSASSPLQVLASLSQDIRAISFDDGIAQFVGVYVGGVGSEVRRALIGGGTVATIDCFIPKGSRISLRSETAAAINTGQMAIQFQVRS